MKIILVFLFLVPTMLQGQFAYENLKDNGIYLSDTDYIKSKLTCAFNKHEGFKFKENIKLPVTIKTSDTAYRFFNDEIWGFRKKVWIGGYSMKNFIGLIISGKYVFILCLVVLHV
ncbi:MAG: hypothetical protein WKG06_21070 [Segetibacter sp.]